MDVFTYIDESGIITRAYNENHRYFTIAMIHTDNHLLLTKRFSRLRSKVIKDDEQLKQTLKISKELKGSEVSEKLKSRIYENLIRMYTNENEVIEGLEIGIIVIDTKLITDVFRENKARVFNYLLSRYFKRYLCVGRLGNEDISLKLLIDNQNVATKSTHTLQDYINTELRLKESIYKQEIEVDYFDSKNQILIQLADYVANSVFRDFNGDAGAAENVELLQRITVGKDFFKFPLT